MNDFIQRYDAMMLHPFMRRLYDDRPYYNVGDWSAGATRLVQACEHLMDRVIDTLPARRGRLLDVGCGLGAGTLRLARRRAQAEVVGINLSHRQLAQATLGGHGAVFQVMDATRMAYEADTFDGMVCVEAAFHFAPRQAFLHEAHRVLRPGGSLVMTDMLFSHADWMGGWTVPADNLVADPNAYARACQAAGFQVQAVQDITACTWHGYIEHLPRWANEELQRTRLGADEAQGVRQFAQDLKAVEARYLFVHLVK